MEFGSFWQEYPDSVFIDAFVKLRNKRGDEISSNLMWYIRFMYDPEHEYISKIPNVRELAVGNNGEAKRDKKSQREKILADYFDVKTTDLNSATFKDACAWYVEHWMPPTKRLLNSLGQKITDAASIAEKFEINTMEDIIKAHDTTEAYIQFKKLYDEAVERFNDEKKKKLAGYGGKPVSAAMDGSLFRKNGTT